MHLWNLYCQSLEKRPLITKSLTSLMGFALGDAIAQASTRPAGGVGWQYDFKRTARMAAFGGLVAGPLGHYWFNFLDKVRIAHGTFS
jgi:protein Mpv17